MRSRGTLPARTRVDHGELLLRRCRGPLRYQGQARTILREFARHGARSIAELVTESEFRRVRLFEPGELGPFRPYFEKLDGYIWSRYESSAAAGEMRDGVSGTDDVFVLPKVFHNAEHLVYNDFGWISSACSPEWGSEPSWSASSRPVKRRRAR